MKLLLLFLACFALPLSADLKPPIPLPPISLHSSKPLPPETEKRIRKLTTSTFQFLQHSSLPLFRPPTHHLRIEIFHDRTAYEAAGAAKGTIGMYQSRPPRILLLEASLTTQPSDSPHLPQDYYEDILVHELTHLAMHGHRHQPIWFREGLAEYVAALHQGNGRMDTSNPAESVRRHLTSRLGNKLPPLPQTTDLLNLSPTQWLDRIRDIEPSRQYLPYASALLLTYHHLHESPDHRKWLQAQLEKPHATTWDDPPHTAAANLAIQRFWQSKRLNITFTPLPKL